MPGSTAKNGPSLPIVSQIRMLLRPDREGPAKSAQTLTTPFTLPHLAHIDRRRGPGVLGKQIMMLRSAFSLRVRGILGGAAQAQLYPPAYSPPPGMQTYPPARPPA